LIIRKGLGSRRFLLPRDLKKYLAPVLVIGVVAMKPNKDGVLANLESHHPITIGSWTIDIEELRDRHMLSLENSRP
jgi:hypothetical protein